MDDLALVDAPAFHLFMDHCNNGEVYDLIVRGGDHGGLDGVDIIGTNIHVHDVMVSNKDECMTVKSPSSNLLIEQIFCNWSRGSAIGSLSTGTAISNVVYQKVYSVNSNQTMIIKSSGGSGYVKNVQFNVFIGHGNVYSLGVDQSWGKQTVGSGNGVQLSNISFENWRGTCTNGAQRGPIKFNCAAKAPCTGMSVQNFAVWTEAGNTIEYTCANAYSSSRCLKASSRGGYASIALTIKSAPASYNAPTLSNNIYKLLSFTSPISIPA